MNKDTDGELGIEQSPTVPRHAAMPASPRDYLANERTLLAWIRTSIALMGLGFVVARFGFIMPAFRAVPGIPLDLNHLSALFGTVIVILAAGVMALSYQRYRHIARVLDHGGFTDTRLLTTTLVVMILLIVVVLCTYLLLTPGNARVSAGAW